MPDFWDIWEPKDLLQAISGYATNMFSVSVDFCLCL